MIVTAIAIASGVAALCLTALIVAVLVIRVVRQYLEQIRASKIDSEVKFVYTNMENGNYVTRAGVISTANLKVPEAKVWKAKELDSDVQKSFNHPIVIRD